MQFFKLSFTQVLVACLMVTSAAGAPLPLSGDLVIRDNSYGLEARDVIYTRDPKSKINRVFSKFGNAIKPIAQAGIQTALPGVEIAKRNPEPKSKIGRFFSKVGKTLKPIAQTAIQTVLPGVEIAKRNPEPKSKIGRFFSNVGKTLKKEGEIFSNSVKIAAGAMGLYQRDVIEARNVVDTLKAHEFLDILKARDFDKQWE